MLHIITGDCGSGKTTRIIEHIKQDILHGIPCYCIVPEQQTVSYEVLMLDKLTPEAPLLFEVTNFTRLADTVFRMVGGLTLSNCTPAIKDLVMWHTLLQVAPLLKNCPSKIDSSTVLEYRNAVNELSGMCFYPIRMKEIATQMSDTALGDKLTDLSQIVSAYQNILEEKFKGAGDIPERLAEALRSKAPLKNTHIYIDGFSSFTEQEYRIIDELLTTSPVTIALSIPPNPDRQLSAGEVMHTLDRLTELAGANAAPGEQLEGVWRATDPTLRYVTDHMFRTDYAAFPPLKEEEHSDVLRLVEAVDPIDACEFIAGDIREKVEKGAAYRDFAIVCATPTSYIGILDTALNDACIPSFFSIPTPLLSLEPIKLIFSVYRIFSHRWQREDVIGYLKCGMCGVDRDTCDLIESYCETWKIKGKAFFSSQDWQKNPDGLQKVLPEREPYITQYLARINQAKQTFVTPLVNFEKKLTNAIPVTQHIEHLVHFLLALQFPKQVQQMGEHAMQRGDKRRGEAYLRLWDLLCDCLDDLALVLGEETLSANEFADLLKLLLSSCNMGHIPAGMDEVMVGAAATLRSEGKRHVYLLGVNEDEFPAAVHEKGIFTAAERQILKDNKVSFSDSQEILASRELFCFYRALTLCEESVTLIRTQFNAAFGECHPSDALKRIRSLLHEKYPVTHLSAKNILGRILTPEIAFRYLGRTMRTPEGQGIRAALEDIPALEKRMEATGHPIQNLDLTLSPKIASLLFDKRISLSKSRIEKYAKCPLSYFCEYILHLSKEEVAEFNVLNAGIYIHAILELFLKHTKEHGIDFRTMEDQAIADLVEQFATDALANILPKEEETPSLMHYVSYMVTCTTRVTRVLAREFCDSDFYPTLFEVPIDDKDPAHPQPLSFQTPGGRLIRVTGVIDRVDTYTEGDKTYVRVVDYKTGTQQFQPDNIDKGLDLQMLLYLFSIWKTDSAVFKQTLGVPEGGQILPAGIMYLSSLLAQATADSKVDDAGAEAMSRKQIARSGLLLYDDDMLEHMDHTPKKEHLFVSYSKGAYSDASLRKLKTLEEMGELLTSIGDTLSHIGGKMESGYIPASPLKKEGKSSTCDYCPYKSVCRNPQ